jgi:hypothetical protein
MPIAAQAVEWWEWDKEYSYTPEESCQEFGISNFNTTFYQYSDENNFVFDDRGISAFIEGEGSTFLSATLMTSAYYSTTSSPISAIQTPELLSTETMAAV